MENSNFGINLSNYEDYYSVGDPITLTAKSTTHVPIGGVALLTVADNRSRQWVIAEFRIDRLEGRKVFGTITRIFDQPILEEVLHAKKEN